MTTFDNSFKQKISHKFVCVNCDYSTSKKSNYDAHKTSTKHYKNNSLTTFDNAELKQKTNSVHICNFCDKTYNDRAGLWRHKKKCKQSNDTASHNFVIDKELVMLLIKENSELKTMMLEEHKSTQQMMMTTQTQIMEVLKTGTHNTTNNNNSHNKTFNLQFFLNETCKNAMNIMDFVDSLKLQLNDLERMGEIGFVNGMSNIIIKNLQNMDVTERPVHCTDQKREVIYVKDADKWDKEEDTKPKLRKAIKHIAHKNAKLISEFKTKHPDYCKSASQISTQYNTMVIEAMGGIGSNDLCNENKIIKRISKEIMVDKE
jgi:hypothetical protein